MYWINTFIIIVNLPNLLGITTIHHDRPEDGKFKMIGENLTNTEREKRLNPYIEYYNTPLFLSTTQQPEFQQQQHKFTPFLESNALPGKFTPIRKHYQQQQQQQVEPNYSELYDKLSKLKIVGKIRPQLYPNQQQQQQVHTIPYQRYKIVQPSKTIIESYTVKNIDIPSEPPRYQQQQQQQAYIGHQPIQNEQYLREKPRQPIIILRKPTQQKFYPYDIEIQKPIILVTPHLPSNILSQPLQPSNTKTITEENYQNYSPPPSPPQRPLSPPLKYDYTQSNIYQTPKYVEQQQIYIKPDKYIESPKHISPSQKYIQSQETLEPQRYIPNETIEEIPKYTEPQRYIEPQQQYIEPPQRYIENEPAIEEQQQKYISHTTKYPNEQIKPIRINFPSIQTNNLGQILKQLQDSNTLPQTLTVDNIDNSIKTLVDILNSLKKQKFTKPIIVKDDNDYVQEEQEEEKVNHPGSITQTFPANTVEGGTPGKPGIDYPALSSIPQTDFNCKTQRYKGFFGDPNTNCQVWHYCDLNGGQASFLCPNGTIFSQVALTCDWWYNVKCDSTAQLYVLNERLYKYILPLTPKFPEDYSGPLVDKYLAMKFQEMEEKMAKEKKGKVVKEQTESDEDEDENENDKDDSDQLQDIQNKKLQEENETIK